MSDTIYSPPGATFYSELENAPTGLVGTVGVQMLDRSDDAVVMARTTAGIAEVPAGSGMYKAALEAPEDAGSYTVLWDIGAISPSTTGADDLVVTHTIASIVEPATGQLVSLAEVKDYLDITGSEDDPILETLIRAVTRNFAGHTRREFLPTASSERVFAHRGGRLLNIDPFDLRSVTQVRTGVEGESPTTLAATEYSLRPLPTRDAVFQWLRLKTEPAECEIAVTGDWGFASVPADIRHFALTQIALWMKRELQTFERTFSVDAGFLERPEALASAVRGGLADYARVVAP